MSRVRNVHLLLWRGQRKVQLSFFSSGRRAYYIEGRGRLYYIDDGMSRQSDQCKGRDVTKGIIAGKSSIIIWMRVTDVSQCENFSYPNVELNFLHASSSLYLIHFPLVAVKMTCSWIRSVMQCKYLLR